jgi:hypothetical protein
MIHEAVVITRNEDRTLHIVPLGYRECEDGVVLAPFRPSATLRNLERDRQAVLNLTDNVQVIAGCLTGRRNWPTVPGHAITVDRLEDTLSHRELVVETIEEDAERPRFYCRTVHVGQHAAFRGFNRAQAACLEAAILVSRLSMLPREKVDREVDYLRIAVDKTAGERERIAWDWLMQAIQDFRTGKSRGTP